jgi:predicted TIM-barrel fold metal-dependent hydrolase
VQITLKHMGYEYLRDAIVVARLSKNVFLESAGNTSAAEIRAGIKGAGADKVVYGSDLPYVSPEVVIQRIQLMEDVSDRDKEAILGDNMARLHNRK